MDKAVIYIVKGAGQFEPSWVHSLWYSKEMAESTAWTLTEMAGRADENNDEFFYVDEHKVSDG